MCYCFKTEFFKALQRSYQLTGIWMYRLTCITKCENRAKGIWKPFVWEYAIQLEILSICNAWLVRLISQVLNTP